MHDDGKSHLDNLALHVEKESSERLESGWDLCPELATCQRAAVRRHIREKWMKGSQRSLEFFLPCPAGHVRLSSKLGIPRQGWPEAGGGWNCVPVALGGAVDGGIWCAFRGQEESLWSHVLERWPHPEVSLP